MVARILLEFILVGLLALSTEAIPDCGGANEIYDSCGTACERTCANRNELIACIEICVQGCFCDEGFIRDENNRCILESECPQTCGENEIYTACGSGCGEPTCNGGGGGIICPAVCTTGCLCVGGFVRDENNRCILESECPQAQNCQRGETFSACHSPCPELPCPGYPLPGCVPGAPCIAGCFCNAGLVRHNGQCISPDDCVPFCKEGIVQCLVDPCEVATCPNFPNARCVSNYCGGCNADFYDENDNPVECTSCGANEIYDQCGTACERTCANRNEDIACHKACVQGCFCNQRFIRDENNRCILERECPEPSCGANEIYDQCGTACERTCENRNEDFACITVCVAGCFCDEGFIRDEKSRCIPEGECPALSGECSNEGEVYTECASRCGEPTCDGVPQVRCAKICTNTGCLCDNDNGYVRGPLGDCILSSNCPQAKNCQIGETYFICHPPCSESTCPAYQLPSSASGTPCVAGCFCSDGLVRHNGQCILPNDCPACDIVNCRVDPCRFATCNAFPDATCVSNYCGGCNAIFYNHECRVVNCNGKPSY